MAYKNILWQNNKTPLNADNMNNIMEGINLALGYDDASKIPENGITKPAMFRLGIANYSIVGNDLENNKAYGNYSTAMGKYSISGTRCFTITATSVNESNHILVSLDSVDGIEVGQECRFKTNSEYYSEVLEINGNNVTLNALNSSAYDLDLYTANINKGEYTDSENPYLVRLSDGTDSEKNSFFIVGHPEIGTDRVLGSTSVAFGSNNQASVFNTIVAGGDNFALGGYSAVFGYKNKGAYGSIIAGRNNDARLSEYSAVFGYNNTFTAKSNFSYMFGNKNTVGAEHGVAIGYSNQSLGKGAMAFGYENTVTGIYSIALGFKHKIDGIDSLAVGSKNTIDTNGGQSLVAGSGNTVSAPHSAVFGMNNVIATSAKSGRSIASGSENVINHNYCATFGKQLETGRDSQIIVGRQNVVDSNAVFIVANGTLSTGASNAFIVKSDGSAEVQTQGTTDNSVATKNYVDNMAITQSQVSQIYDPTSSQAMSGVAVAGALSGLCQHTIIPNGHSSDPDVPDMVTHTLGCRCIKLDNFVNYQTYDISSRFPLSSNGIASFFHMDFPYRADVTLNPQVSASGKLKSNSETVMYDIYAVTFDSYGNPESICAINSQTNSSEEFVIGETKFTTYGLSFNYICTN